MKRCYYDATISDFLQESTNEIFGKLSKNNEFSNSFRESRDAWHDEIEILKTTLPLYRNRGSIFFEYSIPRMGKRIDVVLIIDGVVFVLEFKVGKRDYKKADIAQVWDYALDLKNFHEPSHDCVLAPILIATEAEPSPPEILQGSNDNLLYPIKCNSETLPDVIEKVLDYPSNSRIKPEAWIDGGYFPTPTIVEAAIALYRENTVEDLSRNDAGAKNLSLTTNTISNIINDAQKKSRKALCFVTGVPGAGKTLIGLNIATKSANSDLHSVFLSGNGPLVKVLQEALARDRVDNEKCKGKKITKRSAMREVNKFIQNVHNFRDECLCERNRPPDEHVALFDEAQRAWNQEQTEFFMKRKKRERSFNQSEPEYLISCLDRHKDWAVVVCLVGGGQEINTGEAGISEWIEAWKKSYNHWDLYISSRLTDEEYNTKETLLNIIDEPNVTCIDDLHLAVSMRSFRAENVSDLIKYILDRNIDKSRILLDKIKDHYPIILTRDIKKAKDWLKRKARGSERYGIIVSSSAERLKPHAINVKSPVDPVHWFLNSSDDVRSSYYLEDVATEFHVQGLELDWACITWDGDFRYSDKGWGHFSFSGNRWNNVKKIERQVFLKNAYRVLLTRARQGMVIVIPEGDQNDPTRKSEYYDPTYEYLKSIGFEVL